MVIDYYNRFMELAQHARSRAADMSSLISKCWTRLRRYVFEKLVALRFNNLVDCYAATLQVETSLDMSNVERA